MNIVAGNNQLNVSMSLLMGSLNGVVTDAAGGAALPGVTVSVDTSTAVTDSNGAYAFTNIIPGNHVVKFEKAGYVTQTF